MRRVVMIAAVASNGVIGDKGRLPWSLPQDLKLFKSLTMDCPLIVGRKTFESMPKIVWQTRSPFVLTRQNQIQHEGNIVISAELPRLIDAATKQSPTNTAFIAGGVQLFEEALGLHEAPLADQLIITHVNGDYEGDTRLNLDLKHFERRNTLLTTDEFSTVLYTRR